MCVCVRARARARVRVPARVCALFCVRVPERACASVGACVLACVCVYVCACARVLVLSRLCGVARVNLSPLKMYVVLNSGVSYLPVCSFIKFIMRNKMFVLSKYIIWAIKFHINLGSGSGGNPKAIFIFIVLYCIAFCLDSVFLNLLFDCGYALPGEIKMSATFLYTLLRYFFL